MKKEMYQPNVLVLLELLRKLLHRGAAKRVVHLLSNVRAVDISRIMTSLSDHDRKSLFAILTAQNTKRAANILREIYPSVGISFLDNCSKEELVSILQELPSDDRAEIMGDMSDELREELLELMRERESVEVQDLLRYGEKTAGRIMIPEFFALPEDAQVKHAIEYLQKSTNVEMAFYLYVVSKYNHLLGVISLRQLLLVPPETKLRDVMSPDVISVHPDTDQEEVARIVARYNLLAVPVVDEQGKLLGIITVDDIVDIIREEATEDFLKMAGIGAETILGKSTVKNFLTKLPWLLIPWLGEIVAANIINSFQGVLTKVIALAAFIPVVMGMGGNIATQSATIVVRGLVTGRINIKNIRKIIFREVIVAVLLGAVYGVMLGFITRLQMGSIPFLTLTVSLGIFCAMVIAAVVGSFGPLALQKMRADPAVASGPFVTTTTDILGSAIYFSIAYFLLLR
ncbi:MAG: magnesium transporter [Candidatus Aminicenantes bacterium]|nr:magnesium transporter [Candidatus Aminicenantes bacterium]